MMFTYPPLPIGGYTTEKLDTEPTWYKPIDGYHVYKVMREYPIFDKNLYVEVLKYLNSDDTLIIPFVDTFPLYKKGYNFFINYTYTNSLNGLCEYLMNKELNWNSGKLIRKLFEHGATDVFFTNLIKSAKSDNYDLFTAIYSSTIFTVSDIKFITEALYTTKNKKIQEFIIDTITMIGMENVIDNLRILDSR